MKASELRSKSVEELGGELIELRRAQFSLRMQLATQQLNKVDQMGKVIRRSNKFHAHDESNECKEGDLVVIEESRPLSKTKTWKVSKIVEKSRIV